MLDVPGIDVVLARHLLCESTPGESVTQLTRVDRDLMPPSARRHRKSVALAPYGRSPQMTTSNSE